MNACILSVGDELILGTTLDTNSQRLSQWLRDAGCLPVRHITVADDLDAIASAIEELAERAEVVIVTGGLGPTDDDRTRDALNIVTDDGAPMIEDAERANDLLQLFQSRGRVMPKINLRQALHPRSARMLPNPHGTAPGLAATVGSARVYCLPGPPSEMAPMFHSFVQPELAQSGLPPIVRRSVQVFGLGESQVAERLGDLMDRAREPLIGTTASQSVVTIQIVGHGADAANRALADAAHCARMLAPYSLGENGLGLEEALLSEAAARNTKLAVAESCTAGLVASMIASVPGASASLAGGWITYSNEMKMQLLGVEKSVLDAHGAVSAQCACAMADGAAQRSRADLAVAVTGIAGPDGGTPDKPVGTVWIAVSHAGAPARARRFRYPGDRDAVRHRAAKSALQLARWSLMGVDAPLLWERS